jgi:hypothetical protein
VSYRHFSAIPRVFVMSLSQRGEARRAAGDSTQLLGESELTVLGVSAFGASMIGCWA